MKRYKINEVYTLVLKIYPFRKHSETLVIRDEITVRSRARTLLLHIGPSSVLFLETSILRFDNGEEEKRQELRLSLIA